MSGDVEIAAFGRFEVRGSSGSVVALGGRKPKQVLQLLVAARGHVVSKESLSADLWNEHPPRHPIAALENNVWVLRHRLREAFAELPIVLTDAEAYRLADNRVSIDLDRFDRLVAAADRVPLVARRTQLQAALELVRGEVFEDEPYAAWAAPLRDSYQAVVQRVLLDVAEASMIAGDHRATVDHASRALTSEPLSERACQLLMLGLAARGERQRAHRVFEAFRASLRAELGLDPLPATLAVYERVRSGELRPSDGSDR